MGRKRASDIDIGFDDEDSGFGSLTDRIMAALAEAGYGLENERDVQWGMMAYNAAAMVKLSVTGGRAATRDPGAGAGPGRNAPCPCGSGKKYKRCCLKKAAAAGARPSWRPAPGPGVEPELIPNMTSGDSARRDMEVLAALLESDPGLRKVRFPRAAAAAFAERELARAPEETRRDPVLLSQFINEVSHRYVSKAKEADAGAVLEGLEEALMEAAGRAAGPDELRSIVLGVVYCMAIESEVDAPNPLAAMIFRLSIMEHARGLQSLDRIIDGLGPGEELSRRLAADDPGLKIELDGLTRGMDTIALEALEDAFEDGMSHMSGIIR